MCFVVQNSICEISYGDGGGGYGHAKEYRTIYECIDGGDTAKRTHRTEYAKAYDAGVLVIGCEFRFFMGVSYGILI